MLELSDEIDILNRFLDLGPEIVVLKVGEDGGAYLGTREEITHISGYKVERIVDPIGAGDAFAAGFLAGLINGYTLKDAVRLANAAGAFALTVKGDVEGVTYLGGRSRSFFLEIMMDLQGRMTIIYYLFNNI